MTTLQTENSAQAQPSTHQATEEENHIPAVSDISEAVAENEEEIPHMPDPSIWPIVIALGVSVLILGIALSLWVIAAGLAILLGGLGGWIYQDIQVARRGDHH